MPYTDKIVDYIDTQLKATSLLDKRFSSGKYYGLMQLMSLKEKSYGPAKPDVNGEMIVAYPDDTNSITTYHRIISMTYDTGRSVQFGDNKQTLLQTTDMVLTAIGFIDQLKILNNQLEGLLAPGIPSQAKALAVSLSFNDIFIKPTSSRFDSQQIFNEEFRGVSFLLKPAMILIQIKYRIEAEFRKDCFKICEC